jgi:hypothetical protein
MIILFNALSVRGIAAALLLVAAPIIADHQTFAYKYGKSHYHEKHCSIHCYYRNGHRYCSTRCRQSLIFLLLDFRIRWKLIKNKKISSSASYSGCSSSSGGGNSDDSSVRGSNSAYGSIRGIHGVHGSIGMLMPVGFQLGDLKQRVKLLLRLLRY